MLWTLLAAQISAPEQKNAASWFSPQDVPQFLLREGSGLWQVPVRLTIDPNGFIKKCEIGRAGGIADLNRLTCNILLRRAKFEPASIDGIAAFGVYRTSIKWAIADVPWDTSKVSDPDLDVTVEHLPAGVESPVLLGVKFVVDARGNKSSCVGSGANEKTPERAYALLAPVACEQIMQNFPTAPAMDRKDAPVVSVQNALVRFSGPTSN